MMAKEGLSSLSSHAVFKWMSLESLATLPENYAGEGGTFFSYFAFFAYLLQVAVDHISAPLARGHDERVSGTHQRRAYSFMGRG
jgi:hypothetical protein